MGLIIWNSFYQNSLIDSYSNVILIYKEKNCFSEKNCVIEESKSFNENLLVCRTEAILI